MINPRPIRWAVVLVPMVLATAALGDYLEVRQSARIYAEPDNSGPSIAQVTEGTVLQLVNTRLRDRYYQVEVPDSHRRGWIHQSRGRGFRGDPPDTSDSMLVAHRRRHLRIGAPRFSYEIVREGYVAGYDGRLKIPLWVQYEITKDEAVGGVPRRDDFRPDPTIPAHTSATLDDYKEDLDPADGEADFDRGHLAPAEDMSRSDRLMSDSFFLTNMVPQVGGRFNSTVWRQLEAAIHKWARGRDRLTIITGPVFAPSHAAPGGTSHVEYRVIGESRVAVPTHMFKIVIDDEQPHDPAALAFIYPNQEYPSGTRFDHDQFITTIDRIEELTGLDFLDALDDATEEVLEERRVTQMWPTPPARDDD